MQHLLPYNPLDKRNLAESIGRALLNAPVRSLADTGSLIGAGVYVLYYAGELDWYGSIAANNRNDAFGQPIYIGKAIPKGGRKGGIGADAGKGTALRDRLGQHRDSVDQAENLKLSDFYYRCLVVDDIWIPLGENMLIEQFRPVWNIVIDGFGNKDPGSRRKDQYRSPWDVLHPGREFAHKLAAHPRTQQEIVTDLVAFNEAGMVQPRKKKQPIEQDLYGDLENGD